MDKYNTISSRISVLERYRELLKTCSTSSRLAVNSVAPANNRYSMDMTYYKELEVIQRYCDEELLKVVNNQIEQDVKMIEAVDTLLS